MLDSRNTRLGLVRRFRMDKDEQIRCARILDLAERAWCERDPVLFTYAVGELRRRLMPKTQ